MDFLWVCPQKHNVPNVAKSAQWISVFSSKGQLISKCPFGVFKSPKKPLNFFPGLLP
jgi:hypothetical protein